MPETRLNIRVVKEQFFLEGIINEAADYLPLLDCKKSRLKMNLANVTRINSVGIRVWLQLNQKLKGKLIEYHECSVAVINTANLIKGFFEGQIISFYVPFVCNSCENEFDVLFQTKDNKALQQVRSLTSSQPCTACAKPATLNEDEHLYFDF